MTRPLPLDLCPDELDLPFWEGAARHELLVHRCALCTRSYWPATCCPEHGWASMEWARASGRGVVHTFTVVHHAFDRNFADRLPYVVAVVRLEEDAFYYTDLVDCDPAAVEVGMAVVVTFEDVDARNTVPRFRPA